MRKKYKNGYGVVELIFYISIFATISLVVINAMLAMTKSLKETAIQNQFIQAGSVMERISREVRAAESIASITGTTLKLNTTDENGAAKTVEFLLSAGDAQIKENDVLTGALNSPNITVSALGFTQVTTAEGTAVKITLTFSSDNDALGRSQDFYNTITLRGSYGS